MNHVDESATPAALLVCLSIAGCSDISPSPLAFDTPRHSQKGTSGAETLDNLRIGIAGQNETGQQGEKGSDACGM